MVNSRRAEQERQHKLATAKAREMTCLVCGMYGCSPCHWPRHRGSGGRFENEWADEVWVPLCDHHHSLVDGRLGVSLAVEMQRRIAIQAIERRR